MNIIKIQDITQSHRAISANDGDKVFDLVNSALSKGESIILDFKGIELTITAFLNAAIGRLYSVYSSDNIRELLDIVNMQPEERPLLKLVVDKAKERFTKPYPTDLGSIDLLNED